VRTNAQRLGSAINTIRREPLLATSGRIQDDRGTIRHQRKRLLPREKEAFHIDVKDRVIELLSDRPERGILRNSGIREHNIDVVVEADRFGRLPGSLVAALSERPCRGRI
jgi:hypothetical protein